MGPTRAAIRRTSKRFVLAHGGLRTYFRPSVLCVYEVKGRQYPATAYTLPWSCRPPFPGCRAIDSEVPIGMKVDVHYNPQKPSQSVLHPWSWWVTMAWLIVVGLNWIGMGVGSRQVTLFSEDVRHVDGFHVDADRLRHDPGGDARYRDHLPLDGLRDPALVANDGTVITSRVVSRTTNEHGANNSDLTNTPLVEYEYQVNDQSFRGDRIMIGGGKSEVELEYVLGRYPLGAKVVVYYNPADPQQAVLERGIPATGFGVAASFSSSLPACRSPRF